MCCMCRVDKKRLKGSGLHHPAGRVGVRLSWPAGMPMCMHAAHVLLTKMSFGSLNDDDLWCGVCALHTYACYGMCAEIMHALVDIGWHARDPGPERLLLVQVHSTNHRPFPSMASYHSQPSRGSLLPINNSPCITSNPDAQCPFPPIQNGCRSGLV